MTESSVTRRRQTGGASALTHAPTRTLVDPIIKNQASYDTLHDNGNVNGNITIDWTNGNVQKMTLTGNVTAVAFTNPVGPCTCKLWIHAGTGGFTVANWDGDCDWGVNASEPTVTATANKFDLGIFEYDGGSIYVSQLLQGREGQGFG